MNSTPFGVSVPGPVQIGSSNSGINPNIPDRAELASTTPSVNFKPAVDDKEKAVKPGDEPLPMYTPPGFCAQTVYGCCSDGMIAKIDEFGSNCPRSRPTTTGGLSSLLAVRVINQLFPPRDPRPRVRVEEPGYR
jgi:hypothetical protein